MKSIKRGLDSTTHQRILSAVSLSMQKEKMMMLKPISTLMKPLALSSKRSTTTMPMTRCTKFLNCQKVHKRRKAFLLINSNSAWTKSSCTTTKRVPKATKIRSVQGTRMLRDRTKWRHMKSLMIRKTPTCSSLAARNTEVNGFRTMRWMWLKINLSRNSRRLADHSNHSSIKIRKKRTFTSGTSLNSTTDNHLQLNQNKNNSNQSTLASLTQICLDLRTISRANKQASTPSTASQTGSTRNSKAHSISLKKRKNKRKSFTNVSC